MILGAFSSNWVRSLRTYFGGRTARLAAGAELSSQQTGVDFDPLELIEPVPRSATVTVERRALRIQAPLVWRPAGLPAFAPRCSRATARR